MDKRKSSLPLSGGGIVREIESPSDLVPIKDIDEKDRGQWGSRTEFFLACVGMSVGIGNIWRFPYLAYKNGGAAFLIPYFILLVLVGKPMYFLEIAIGQFASASPIVIWKCCPIGKGVGWAMQVVVFLVVIYYNVIVAYTIFFMISCFAPDVPWKDCYEWWGADEKCHLRRLNATRPCLQMIGSQIIHMDYINGTCHSNVTAETASTQYWRKYVLHIDESEGIGDLGEIRWDLCLCLLLAWIIVFLSLIKGVQSSGKVVYFSATFPYLVLIILVVEGLTLDGAVDGLKYLFIPEWSKLLHVEVWRAAAEQMFYSLGLSWGVIMTFGSYNQFRNRTHIDAMVVSFIDFATSLIGCIAIFSILGYLAKQLGVEVDQVAAKGPGLTFEVYPEALALLPVAPLWSFLFFFMLFTLGLDSEFGTLETILSCIFDAWPVLRKHKSLVVLICCIICFLFGLPCVASGGQYFLNLMDTYSAGTSVLFIAFFEMAFICWVYGSKRLIKDIEFMLEYKMSKFWYISWTFICPAFLGTIFILACVFYEHVTYEKYIYPSWAEGIGLVMQLASMVQIPIWAIIALYQHYKKGDIMGAFQPEDDWGPADPELKREWEDSKNLLTTTTHWTYDSVTDGIDNPNSTQSTLSLSDLKSTGDSATSKRLS